MISAFFLVIQWVKEKREKNLLKGYPRDKQIWGNFCVCFFFFWNVEAAFFSLFSFIFVHINNEKLRVYLAIKQPELYQRTKYTLGSKHI